jgi:hypothetical protein
MSATLDRLRRLVNLRQSRVALDVELSDHDGVQGPTARPPGGLPAAYAAAHAQGPSGRLEELVPGRFVENAAGVCYISATAYPLHEPRGPRPLGTLLDLAPSLFHPYHANFHLDAITDFRAAAFLDTETTGLGTGSGVYCFMVGVGAFESRQPHGDPTAAPVDHFVVRQYFMQSPAQERALLLALAQQLAPYSMTVTFNGRSFDLPLLRTRYSQNRRLFSALRSGLPLLDEGQPHLDLLYPARRLWRRRVGSCRLINLEQMILGLQRGEDDVPGHLIPMLYGDYMLSGNAADMRRVFYHNAEDIVSMVALAEHLARAYGTPEEPLDGLDLAALGRIYEQQGDLGLAESAYRRALETVRRPRDQAELFARLAATLKRQARWHEAAEIWQLWLTTVPGVDPTPFVELAKYCEWQINDLEQAEMWTAWALHNFEHASTAHGFPGARRELEHRLARLQRKRNGS